MNEPVSNEPVTNGYGDNPRNPVKVAHLVFGSFFIGIAILWALTESDTISWQGTSYLVPLTLLLAGAIGLGASLAGNNADRRRRRRTASSEAASEAASPEAASGTASGETATYDVSPTDDSTATDTDDTREL